MSTDHKLPYEKRILDIKLSHLQAFACVAKMQSFSAAALQLCLTQPSISRRIASLESALGTALFDRVGSRVLLTEAGQLLLPKAQHILAETEDAQRLMHKLSGKVSGRLGIGVSGYIAESYLRPILQRFTDEYPDVQLDIRLFGSSVNACAALEGGELDLAIATLPLAPMKHFQTTPIWEDPLSFVVNKKHPLAKSKNIQLKALADHTAIIPETGTLTRQIIDACFAKHNQQIVLASQIPKPANFQVIKMMVSLGLGWSVLPTLMLDKTFQKITINKVHLKRYLGVIQHKKRTLSNAAEKLLTIFQDA